MRVQAVLGLLAVSLAAHAQQFFFTPVFSPSIPTAATPIIATVTVHRVCTFAASTTVSGNVVTTTFTSSSCIPGPPLSNQQAAFGPLPAGTYTYVVKESLFGDPPAQIAQTTLVVAPAAAPVPVSRAALAVLVVGLAIAALIAGTPCRS
jgi:hypothetical protein